MTQDPQPTEAAKDFSLRSLFVDLNEIACARYLSCSEKKITIRAACVDAYRPFAESTTRFVSTDAVFCCLAHVRRRDRRCVFFGGAARSRTADRTRWRGSLLAGCGPLSRNADRAWAKCTLAQGTSPAARSRSITQGVCPPLTAMIKRPRWATAARASAAMMAAAS